MGQRKQVRKASSQKARRVPLTGYYLLVGLVVLVSALPRVRLRDLPLERDEGEYAYAGQLLLEGIPPYSLAYNMKLPGTYAAYALMMAVFGQTPAGIHTGLLLVNAATTVIMFFVARRLFDPMAGLVAAASYALLATSPAVLGFAGHATHFVVLAAVSGTLVLLIAVASGRTWLFACSGLLFGTAFLMKQPGLFLVVFAAAYLFKSQCKRDMDWRSFVRRLALFGFGAVLPFLLTCLLLWRAGVFHRFWFWTFSYARSYGSIVSIREAPLQLWTQVQHVTKPAVAIWLIGAAGLIIVFCSRKGQGTRWFVAGFLLFSFLAVCPGFYFREHYFIVLLPAIALLAGAGVSLIAQLFRDRANLKAFRWAPAALFLVACGWTVSQQWEFLAEMDPLTACRSMYGPNPFPEALPISDFLRANSSPSASVAILGSEPEIYFYAHRHSATGYIYTYPLMEKQPYALEMQKEMSSEIEKARPEFLVVVGVPTSWLGRPESPQLIFDWADQYLADHYVPAGVVDILQESQYRWGDDAKTYSPLSPYTVRIFRRSSAPVK